jgi:hypothetical protein
MRVFTSNQRMIVMLTIWLVVVLIFLLAWFIGGRDYQGWATARGAAVESIAAARQAVHAAWRCRAPVPLLKE